MPLTIKNVLKKSGIFLCRHPAHEQFEYGVSPYHIFNLNKCWPQGCIEFLWRCRQFEKGQTCPRKYKHVGRGCASCRHYYEIKNCYAPSAKIEKDEMREFMHDLAVYSGWIDDMRNKTVRFSGKLESVRPHLAMLLEGRRSSVRMEEFFASLPGGYIDRDFFDDKIYLRISANFLGKYRPAPGDELECDAIFHEDKGRIILRNPRRVEIIRNGGKSPINSSKALVGRATGKIIKGRIEYCKGCEFCSLVDVEDLRKSKSISYRRFFCLRGISDPANCPVRLGLIHDNDAPVKTQRRF